MTVTPHQAEQKLERAWRDRPQTVVRRTGIDATVLHRLNATAHDAVIAIIRDGTRNRPNAVFTHNEEKAQCPMDDLTYRARATRRR